VLASATESACKSCGVEKLTFEPPPLYCSSCNVRIKPKQSFYAAQVPSQTGEAKQNFCTGCYQQFGPTVEIEGTHVQKSALMKRKNEEDLEEPWVQCDACQEWVHQICTLFNGRRNEGGESAFTCPSCMLDQQLRGERTPTVNRPSSQQPASSLPRTQLSDYLEHYLGTRLVSERLDRARVLGKTPEEVPGAEGLCIRVVSCVDKRLDVKGQFYRAFASQQYPDHFMYRSKARFALRRALASRVCCVRRACARADARACAVAGADAVPED
jgi:E1A/CREB-binding protein